MSSPEVYAIRADQPIANVEVQKGNYSHADASSTIDAHYKAKAKNQINGNESNPAINGAEILNQAAGGTSYVDSEIKRLSAEIKAEIEIELKKKNPSWTNIDFKIRQLAVFLLRKAGISEQEITQQEIERMREDIIKVKKTFNSMWSLAASIGTGAISVIGGLVGIGGAVAGISELAKGAAKVSATVNQFTQMGTSASSLANGLGQAINGPINSHYEQKRTMEQFNLEHSRNQKDTASQAASQNNNQMREALSNLARREDSENSAKTTIANNR